LALKLGTYRYLPYDVINNVHKLFLSHLKRVLNVPNLSISVTREIGDISYFVSANGDVSKEIIIKLR